MTSELNIRFLFVSRRSNGKKQQGANYFGATNENSNNVVIGRFEKIRAINTMLCTFFFLIYRTAKKKKYLLCADVFVCFYNV